ncbi:unnamed protein product [Didymodactylos carnosus]|nr:unnamed protein product [Didymodactylos carnosus]CAF3829314.1 unnamed protein product [Didymodactylos carnosus]
MNRKRTTSPSADQNNNQIVKKQKTNQISAFASSPTCASSSLSTITITRSQLTLKPYTIGQLKSVTLINFMNHSNFKIKFDSTHLQIVTGKNGSGKSAIANGICLALGARANTTGRTQNAQSFVKKNSR